MLRAAITFVVLGIVSMLLGVYSVAGLSIEIGKMLLFVFLFFSIITFVAGMFGGHNKKNNLLTLALVISVGGLVTVAFADDTVKATTKEVASDTKRGAKKAVRSAKDKTCAMINGKMECTVQRAKHSIQEGADHVEDAVD